MEFYSERDIKAILSRATELQQKYANYADTSLTGRELTFEEIQEIAKDLGVSEEFVKEAALEYEGIPVEEPLFLDTGNNFEAEVIGFARGELDEKIWTEILSVIEAQFKSPGNIKRRFGSIIWKAKPSGFLKFMHTRKSPVVEIASTGGRVSIRTQQSLKTYNKLLYPTYAAFFGAATLFGIMLNMGNDIVPMLFVIGLLLGTAKLFSNWAQSKKRKAREELKDFSEKLQTIITRQFKIASTKESVSDKGVIIPDDERSSSKDNHTHQRTGVKTG